MSWEAITAVNVFIELILFALPIWLVWGLQTDTSRKITVVAVFSLRLPYVDFPRFTSIHRDQLTQLHACSVIAAAIARVYYIAHADESTQPLLNSVVPFICMNVETQYGLMAATMPTLKPFVSGFNTGWGTYDTQGVSGYATDAESYAMRSLGAHGGDTRGSSHRMRSFRGSQNMDASGDPDSAGHLRYAGGRSTTSVKGNRNTEHSHSNSVDSESTKQMIIRQTMTCEVSYEDDPVPSGPASMEFHAR